MKHAKIYLLLLGFSLFTGATFNLAKYTIAYIPASFAAAYRFGLAAAIMLIILGFREGIKTSQIKGNFMSYSVLGVIGVFGFNALFFIGLKFTSPLNGALIMATNPLVTAILARIILKETIRFQQAAGMGIALCGVLFVLTQGSIKMMTNLSFSAGDFIILGGNICWAFYGVYGRRFVKNSTSLATAAYSMLIGAFCLIAVSLASSESIHFSSIPIGVWVAIACMSIFTTVLGYLWWNKGMKEIGAAKTSLFFNIVPVVTMLISFFTGTHITMAELSGACLVIIGVASASGILQRKEKPSGKAVPQS
ncbi:EamA family transporter [Bacillus sp. MUM 13]|uniref:DMT family transporter n=1 Tax=Bacillus sp. MUM 13 TaxID=1678001 RepID=UPI0008F586EA|nr:EamA family transporter [Bacillus sp. MUM 13]OIK13333.1 transporter [Bacillus sp. MUM 13]